MKSLFGLKYPLWQAPTGSIAGPELCIAVSEAGAMGGMGLTWTEPESAAEQVRQVRAATGNPFYVNFALAFPPNALEAALQAGVPIVTFSWGDPELYVPLVRKYGAKFGVQVTNAPGVERAIALGADFLIAQGDEAGGHVQSTEPLGFLLPKILAAAKQTPVIAAGGIGHGDYIFSLLKEGAAGAMLGTCFVATQESRAHPLYKAKLVKATNSDAHLTVCFEGGWPYAAHRVLRNSTLENWQAAGSPPVGKRPGEGEITGYSANGEPIFRYEDTAPRAEFTGDIEAMCLYAGTSCDFVRDIPSAGERIRRLWDEFLKSNSGVYGEAR